MMPSPKSSVGSKSIIGRRNIHLQCYQEEGGSEGVFQSPWIRRLHLRPSPNPPPSNTAQPTQLTLCHSPSPVMEPAAWNSPCTTGSGGGTMLSHHDTSSTHESCTPTLPLNTQDKFLHHFLNLRKKKAPMKTKKWPSLSKYQGTCSFSGFGPFQIRGVGSSYVAHPSSWNRLSRPASINAHHSSHQVLQLQETSGACGESFCEQQLDLGMDLDFAEAEKDGIGKLGLAGQDGTAGLDKGMNLSYIRNSVGDVSFPTLKRITSIGQEKKRGNNFTIKQDRFPPNRCRTLFAGETMFAGEINYTNNDNLTVRGEEMISATQRRVTDDHYIIPLSPFFRYWPPSSKKHDCPGEIRPKEFTRSTGKECIFGRSEEVIGKFTGSNHDSHNMNHPWPVGGESRCSPSSVPSVAGDKRLHKQCLPRVQWPILKPFHGINYHSRCRGVTYGESSDDGVAGRISQDLRLMHHNFVEHEKQPHACPNKSEECFSFWNMGRFKRSEMVLSVFQAYSRVSKKRHSNSDEFDSSKSQKLGPED